MSQGAEASIPVDTRRVGAITVRRVGTNAYVIENLTINPIDEIGELLPVTGDGNETFHDAEDQNEDQSESPAETAQPATKDQASQTENPSTKPIIHNQATRSSKEQERPSTSTDQNQQSNNRQGNQR